MVYLYSRMVNIRARAKADSKENVTDERMIILTNISFSPHEYSSYFCSLHKPYSLPRLLQPSSSHQFAPSRQNDLESLISPISSPSTIYRIVHLMNYLAMQTLPLYCLKCPK